MARDDREDDGQEATEAETNVVRLPRDWLGPRDQLVPFGPRARAHEHEREREREHPNDPRGAEPTPFPFPGGDDAGDAASAADFWGERSDALHDALQAPEPASQRPVPGPAESEPTSPEPMRVGGTPVAAATAAGSGPPGGGVFRNRRIWRVSDHTSTRTVAVALAVAAFAGVMIAVTGLFDSGPAPVPAERSNALLHAAASAVTMPVGAATARAASHLRVAPRRHPRPHAVHRSPAAQPVLVASAPTSGGGGSASAATPSATSTAPSGSSSTVTSGGGGSAASANTASGSGSSSAPAAAGPTGQGAVVGPASCGC